jgi:hypothetical protein
MMEEEGYSDQMYNDPNARMISLEEKQRILKDQIMLLGRNLVESKERTNQKIIEIKKEMESMRQNVERISSFIENISGEFSKFARKEDLEILTKQAKMFQPLDFVTKKDLEKLKKI